MIEPKTTRQLGRTASWLSRLLMPQPIPSDRDVLEKLLPTIARADWRAENGDIRQAVLTTRSGIACRVPTPQEMRRRRWWRDFIPTYGLEAARFFDLVDEHNPEKAARLAVDSLARRMGVTSLALEQAMRRIRDIATTAPNQNHIVIARPAGQLDT